MDETPAKERGDVTVTSVNCSRGDAKDGADGHDYVSTEKSRQILDGARKVFMSDGFDGASMNDIARVAEVSKGTLYTYFSSKEELFASLIREDRARLIEPIFQIDGGNPDVRGVLRRVGLDVVRATLTPFNIAYLRMVMAVAAKMPEVGRAYYESGLEYCIVHVAGYLKTQCAARVIEIDDCRLAAAQFLQACHGDNLLRVLFCIDNPPGDAEIAATVERAVDMLLASCAPRADKRDRRPGGKRR